MTAGPLLFARYAYPPNSLGYCGADATRTLLEYGDARASDGGLAELARTFEGAWPYLTLIAHANEIADPLDPRVVQAYWVGNELLDRVEPGDLARHVDARFRGRVGRATERLVDTVAAGAIPHHSFHVFAVYPWLGLLERESSTSRCTSSTAAASRPHGFAPSRPTKPSSHLRPLRWNGGHSSSARGLPDVRWRADGLSLVAPRPGDWVSLHWDFVCDRLSRARQRGSTARLTGRFAP